MQINQATLADITELCDLLKLLFSQELEFKPNADVQAKGLRMII